jgi:predicted dehydrogenase
MTGIIGSGFGLYGHLPAIAQIDTESIFLPQRYKSKFDKRSELIQFGNRIVWTIDEKYILDNSNFIVLSTWPKGQLYWVEKCLIRSNIQYLLLEKPIAISPQLSQALLTKLINSKVIFRVAYSFIYTKWFNVIVEILRKEKVRSIKIKWNFLAHHYKFNLNNWKRYKSLGGSVIRFYGIQILAFISFLGFTKAIKSKTVGSTEDDSSKWEAHFQDGQRKKCEICIDSKSIVNEFDIEIICEKEIYTNESKIIKLNDPFSDIENGLSGLDPRVDIIKKIYFSLKYNISDDRYYKLYQDTNDLWSKIESINIHSYS